MITLAGKISIKIEIDGSEIPSTANMLASLFLTEGYGSPAPACKITLNDSNGFLQTQKALSDGNEILVTIGKDANSLTAPARQYRLFGNPPSPAGGFHSKLIIVGLYDAPGYLLGAAAEAYEGPSDVVLSDIATKCKLHYSPPSDYNGRTMDDTQVWRNGCKSRAVFSADVVRRGYMDASSAMGLALTSLGVLKYRNLSDVIETKIEDIRHVFVHNALPDVDSKLVQYVVREARPRSIAGVMNTWQNYGSTLFANDLSGAQKAHASVPVKTSSAFLPINESVSRTIGRARMSYASLDCGNTHAKYAQAENQNSKLLALFSERVSLMVYETTEVQLYDPVLYRQADVALTDSLKNTDVYIVLGKTIVCLGGVHYGERIELARMSIQVQGDAKLKGASTLEPARDRLAAQSPDVILDPNASTEQLLTVSAKLNALAKSTQDQAAALRTNLIEVNKSVASSTDQIRKNVNMLKALSRGEVPPAIAALALKSLAPNLVTIAAQAKAMSASAKALHTEAKVLRASLSVDPRSVIVKQATLLVPGGVLDVFSAGLGAMEQLADLGSVVRVVDASYAANAHRLQGQAVGLASVASSRGDIDGANVEMQTAMAGSWNNIISIMTGAQIPTQIPQSASLATTAKQAFGPPRSPADQVLSLKDLSSTVRAALLARTPNFQPNFQPEQPLLDRPASLDTALTLVQKVESDCSIANVRNTSLSPTTWSA